MNKSVKLTIVTACAIVRMIMGRTIGHIPSVVFASGGNSSSGDVAVNGKQQETQPLQTPQVAVLL